jgi:hypothetical protein
MTPKLLLILLSAVGIAPAVLWALVSIAMAAFSLMHWPVYLSFRLYVSGSSSPAFRFHELPAFTSICILAGAALLMFGIISIPRYN